MYAITDKYSFGNGYISFCPNCLKPHADLLGGTYTGPNGNRCGYHPLVQ
jgi:hypothetical protein